MSLKFVIANFRGLLTMNIYNTLTRAKEELAPRKNKKIQMFVCGPTVYDYIHIGNARTFVFFDVVAKYLRSRGYEVEYIQNITDIDDKIIGRAEEAGCDTLDWAEEYTKNFKEDMAALGVTAPKYEPATEHIEEVVKQVKILIGKGHAYLIENDGYYFDLKTFPEYGRLSGRTAQMADDAVSRIDESGKKRNKGDFALWKLSKNGEPYWETELGKGRPGWHIEDTAITEHFFGPQYDLHGGGQDLIFPHHEAEIAQQESASGLKPFVRYWMHAGFVIAGSGKMSKSLGNFETARSLLKKYSKEVLRFYLLSGNYRQPLEFSEKMLKQSSAAVQRISELKSGLELARKNGKDTDKTDNIKKIKEEFFKKMDDDFNLPEALAQIFNLVRQTNPIIKSGLAKKEAELILSFLSEVNDVLGIIPDRQKEIPEEIEELVAKREKLREEKNYEESDKIRAQIKNLGWEVEDTIHGPLVIASGE